METWAISSIRATHETGHHPICSNALAEQEQMDSEALLSPASQDLLDEIYLITSSHDDDLEYFLWSKIRAK